MGRELITDHQEQMVLARLNLEASKKARNAMAYVAARQYLMIGKDCLTFKSWVEHYDLTLALHKTLAEIEYLNGNFDHSEMLINLTLEQTKSDFEKAEIYNGLIVQYTMLAKYAEALQIGRKALALLGITLPEEKDLSVAFEKELVAAKANLGDRKIAALINEPELATPEYRIAIELLANMIPPARMLEIQLFFVITTKIVNLSLKYGNVPKSISGYSCYGLLKAAVVNDYQTAYAFGQLAVNMSNKFNDLSQKCQASYLLANYLNHWVKPLKLANAINDDGYQVGLQSGELQWVGYILAYKIAQFFYQGRQLDSLLKESPKFLLFSQKTQNQVASDILLASQLIFSNLAGLTKDKLVFQHQDLNEEDFLENCKEKQSFIAIGNYQVLKAQTLYLYDRLTDSLNAILKAQEVFAFISGSIFVAEHNFYHSLILVALYPKALTDQQEQYQAQLESNQKQMKIWADNCPENFLHKYLLIKAERARIEGKELEAMDLYDQAIASIKEDDFIQNKALANELAAQFWLAKGKEKFAESYLTESVYAYQLWGAVTKVKDLEEKYPQLLASKTVRAIPTDATILATRMAEASTKGGSQWLDLNSIMKASQTLSGEIVLSKLLEKMMQIVIENAGAEKGFLLLPKQDNWFIEAQGHIDSSDTTVLQSLSLEETEQVSVNIIHYVVRTKENVVLHDATQEGNFTRDPYIVKQHPQSVLCAPLVNQGQLTGILYLENNLTTGAFTPERLEVLNLLSSQIAISIENSLLYNNLEQKVVERTHDLGERVKELNCLYSISNLAEKMGISLEEILQGTIEIIPPSWQYPSITGAKIVVNGQEFKTTNFQDTAWLQNSNIVIKGQKIGSVEVCYLEAKPESDEWPFLQEERNLINAIAIQLGRIIENKLAEEALVKRTQELSAALDNLKTTQAQLVESEKMASLGGLVAGVAHEINTPIGIGVTAASTLADRTTETATAYGNKQLKGSALKAYLNMAQSSSNLILNNLNRAAELIQSFKQVAVDQSNLEKRSFAVKEYIKAALINLKPHLKKTPHKITVNGDEQIKLNNYPGAFSQTITNLVMNSVRHAYPKGGAGKLCFELKLDSERLIVEYSDDGCGIPTENRDKIFEPFFTTARAKGGTGLGLHIIFNLVTQKMQGTISVQSEVGVGTTFILNLPLQINNKG